MLTTVNTGAPHLLRKLGVQSTHVPWAREKEEAGRELPGGEGGLITTLSPPYFSFSHNFMDP